ncbi:MAG: ornithine carbamoyltransferase [Cytophagales bacterium]|nr:ornithine carbamoyltransferase [Armatimonadota bacterium]
MATQFTRNGRKAMLWAQVEAMRRGESYVESEHLLLGLLHGEETGALRVLDQLGLDTEHIIETIRMTLKPAAAGTRVETSQLSPTAKKIVQQARRETEQTADDYVGTEHLLLALLRGGENGVDRTVGGWDEMKTLGLTYARAAGVLSKIRPEAIYYPSDNGGVRAPSRATLPTRPAVAARPGFLKGRSLLSVGDLSTDEIKALFELTREIKSGRTPKNGEGKTLALIFEKPSLRTRVTFTVAMNRLGGQSVYLGKEEVGLGTRETVSDVAQCLSRWVDAVAIRTFHHSTAAEFAKTASIPVFNGLTDDEHPCQALADFYTILEQRSETAGMKLVFVGDTNNVSLSLMRLAPRLGTHFTLCCPPEYAPPEAIVREVSSLAKAHGTRFEVSHDPLTASDDADILYTDVWTSMGQEKETARREKDFARFQINGDLIREAKDDVLVLHCLPAHRGEEIAGDIIDGPHAGIFDQAENRLHIQQALLAAVL